jgi:hypothetical protein
MIEPQLPSAQTGLDVAQALAKRELSESQTQKLIPAREILDVPIALVPLDTEIELVSRDEI